MLHRICIPHEMAPHAISARNEAHQRRGIEDGKHQIPKTMNVMATFWQLSSFGVGMHQRGQILCGCHWTLVPNTPPHRICELVTERSPNKYVHEPRTSLLTLTSAHRCHHFYRVDTPPHQPRAKFTKFHISEVLLHCRQNVQVLDAHCNSIDENRILLEIRALISVQAALTRSSHVSLSTWSIKIKYRSIEWADRQVVRFSMDSEVKDNVQRQQ